MTINYYKILHISETASADEIEQAYSHTLKKWEKLRESQTPEAIERSNKIIAYIEQAYQTLSIPEKRVQYDKKLGQSTEHTTPITNQPTKPTAKKSLYRVVILLAILIIIAIGAAYSLFILNEKNASQAITTTHLPTLPTNLNKPKGTATKHEPLKSNPPSTDPKTAEHNQEETTEVATSVLALSPKNETTESAAETQSKNTITLQQTSESDIANQLKKQNAQSPALKEIAKKLAEITNKHSNVVINLNTQFITAHSSNQNITLNFMVIDGIANSKAILDAYLTERFFYDNQICDIQKSNIEKGILFTFAYYNTKNELLGSYYIDQQVCQSPLEIRIVKRPDEYQLKSIEIDKDGKPIVIHSPKDETIKK